MEYSIVKTQDRGHIAYNLTSNNALTEAQHLLDKLVAKWLNS